MSSVLFFIDRQTLAILKSTISEEFGLDNKNYGSLIIAYLLPYTLGYLFSGQLIDRWGTRRCAVFFLMGMSVATVCCGLARNFSELTAAQVMLGLSESGVVPSIMVMITKYFPDERRGFVVTMHQALQSIGPVLTPPLVALLTIIHGWRTSFIFPGILSLTLAIVWYISDHSTAEENSKLRLGAPGFGGLKFVLSTPELRGVVLVRVITDPAWFFLIYWQAAFLQDRGKWTLANLGHWTWIPPAAAALANILAGYWSDKRLWKSGNPVTARKVVLQRLAMLAPCFGLVPFAIGCKPAVLSLLVLCYIMANCWLTMVNVLVTEVAPKGTVATAFGVMSALGGMSSIAFNYIAGPLVDRFGYTAMFVACSCLYPAGVLVLHHYYGNCVLSARKSTEPMKWISLSFGTGMLLFFVLFLTGASVPKASLPGIISYPLPPLYEPSMVYSLKANGISIPVVRYVNEYDYAEFSLSNTPVNLEITHLAQNRIISYSISPMRLGLTATFNGKKLSFTVNKPQYLIVTTGGFKKLVIAIDPAEGKAPASSGTGIFNVLTVLYNADGTGKNLSTLAIQNAINDASAYGSRHGTQGVVYVPPGVYQCGNLKLKSNMALYLAGGSVLYATTNISQYHHDYYKNSQKRFVTWFISTIPNAVNVKMFGRGTVDGNGYYLVTKENFGDNILVPIGCTNFISDGITYRDSGAWAVTPARSADISFFNLKIFNHLNTGEDDGFDVCECQGVVVSNSISIALDDSYSTKTWGKKADISTNWPGESQINDDITFDRCLAWTRCYCYKIGQGVETMQRNITFKNSTAYDCAVAIGINHRYGTAIVTNVSFKNIDIEHVNCKNTLYRTWAAFFFDLANRDGGGSISDLTVKNINIRDAGTSGAALCGRGNAVINGVTFNNIFMPGHTVPAKSLLEMDITHTGDCTNVTILPQPTFASEPPGKSRQMQ